MLKAFFLSVMVALVFLQTSAQPLFIKEYNKGDSFFKINEYDTAIQVFDRLLMQSVPDTFKAEMLHRKGIIFMNEGIEDSAINYEQRALDIFTEQMNFTKMSRAEGNISHLYSSKGIYDKALEYNLSALSSARLPSDSLLQYFNLCNLYQVQGKYQNVYDIVINHILHFKKKLLRNQEFLTASNLGLYFANEKRRDSALYYFKKALSNALSTRDSSAAYNNVCDEYRLAHNYPLAFAYLDSALAINQKSGDLISQLASFETHVQIDTEMHNYADAYKYAQLAREVSDSIFRNGKANALLDAGVKYDAAKKEAANKLLAKDNIIKQRNFIFSLVGLGMLALLAAITFWGYKQKQKANIALTSQKNELRQLANQLELANQTKALLLSTIGHDLRGPLSSLYALLKMQEVKDNRQAESSLIMSGQIIGLLDILENLLAWSKLWLSDSTFSAMPVMVNIHSLYTEQANFFVPTAVIKNIQIVNETPESLELRCDEYMLGTILRNAIGNAMNYAQKEESIVLSAEKNREGRFALIIKNRCSQAGFKQFQLAFNNAAIQNGRYGLGLVLIKDFARIINAPITLSYTDGWAVMHIAIENA